MGNLIESLWVVWLVSILGGAAPLWPEEPATDGPGKDPPKSSIVAVGPADPGPKGSRQKPGRTEPERRADRKKEWSSRGRQTLQSLVATAANARSRAEALAAQAEGKTYSAGPPRPDLLQNRGEGAWWSTTSSPRSRYSKEESAGCVVETEITPELRHCLLSAASAFATLGAAVEDYVSLMSPQGGELPSQAGQDLRSAWRTAPGKVQEAAERMLELRKSVAAAEQALAFAAAREWLSRSGGTVLSEDAVDAMKPARDAFERYDALRTEQAEGKFRCRQETERLVAGLNRIFAELDPSRIIRLEPKAKRSNKASGPAGELTVQLQEVSRAIREKEKELAADLDLKELKKAIADRQRELGEIERSADERIAAVDPEFRKLLAEQESLSRMAGSSSRAGREAKLSLSKVRADLKKRKLEHGNDPELAELRAAVAKKKRAIEEEQQALQRQMIQRDPEYDELLKKRDALQRAVQDAKKASAGRRANSGDRDGRRGTANDKAEKRRDRRR